MIVNTWKSHHSQTILIWMIYCTSKHTAAPPKWYLRVFLGGQYLKHCSTLVAALVLFHNMAYLGARLCNYWDERSNQNNSRLDWFRIQRWKSWSWIFICPSICNLYCSVCSIRRSPLKHLQAKANPRPRIRYQKSKLNQKWKIHQLKIIW